MVVDKRLERILTDNKLHEGFKSASDSTEFALLKVQNDIIQSLDNNCVTVLSYLIFLLLLTQLTTKHSFSDLKSC